MNIDGLIEEVDLTRITATRLNNGQLTERLSETLGAFTGTAENQDFAAQFSPTGNYMRLLLNSPEDEFQIVLVFWGPGQGSPVHDHDGTVGVVSALTGQVNEIKYQISGRDQSGVTLKEESKFTICPRKITTILPEEGKQLHLMANETQQWAATVHVYLTAINSYRVYERQHGDLYRPVDTELWFDRVNVGQEMPNRSAKTSVGQVPAVDAPAAG